MALSLIRKFLRVDHKLRSALLFLEKPNIEIFKGSNLMSLLPCTGELGFCSVGRYEADS